MELTDRAVLREPEAAVRDRGNAMHLIGWDERRPPKSHWVAASYSVMAPLQILKTCKRGCCVWSPVCGSMLLPRYWRDATPEEIAEASIKEPMRTRGFDDLWESV